LRVVARLFYRLKMAAQRPSTALRCALLALIALPVCPIMADAAGPPEPGRALTVPGQGGAVLGFEIGEERHYVLGPADALQRGEAGRWSIHLAEVEGTGRDLRATFQLQHVREAPREMDGTWTAGQVTYAQIDTELVVNAYGAPLHLTYVTQRHLYDIGDEVFQVEYTYDDDKYEKRVALQGTDWHFDIPIIEHAGLDADVPVGLFAFAPGSIDCMEWLAGMVIQQRTGTGDVSAAGASRRTDVQGRATVQGAALAAGSCYQANTDPAFANPGLASLAMPLLWERAGDSELVLFSPLRPDLVRAQGNGIPVTFAPIIPGVPGTGGVLGNTIPGLDLSTLLGGGGTDGDKGRARDPARYFFPRRMQLSERQRIDVGNRKMDALPMEIAGFAGTVWVDDWGKVLRLDVPPLRQGETQRWLRLLHESEY
jgi:hypothetical protein